MGFCHSPPLHPGSHPAHPLPCPVVVSPGPPPQMRNLLDEQTLELFESQSHLLDPETREAVQKQRQFLDWQQNSMEEPGPMQAALERQDSAGSGNEPHEAGSMKRQLHTVAAERDRQAQRSNELCQQLQEKKRQLFTAIQEREQLKEQVRSLDGKLKEYHDVTHCKICRQVGVRAPADGRDGWATAELVGWGCAG